MQCPRESLSIVDGANCKQYQLKVWVELDKHLQDIWTEAQEDRDMLFLTIRVLFIQSYCRDVEILILWKGICLSKD